ncbi:MAG: hypothetical protein L0G02_12800, partial [Lactococcus lactis]|nr:hypothetical protein [Lactococcus lactis]
AILPSGSAGKFLKKIWNFEKWGGTTTPPSRSLVKTIIAPPNSLLLKVYFLDQKKKSNWSKTTKCV